MKGKAHCLVTCRIHQEVIDYLDRYCTLDLNQTDESLTREELHRRITKADAVMMFMPDRVDDALLAEAPLLKVIGAALKGYDNFDVEAATRHGVWLSYVPDLLTEPTAELTVALMLGVSRNIRAGDNRVRNSFEGWRPMLFGTGISGTTIGILGMGNLGQAVAKRLQGWQANLLGFDPSSQAAAAVAKLNVRMTSLHTLLEQSDFILILTPLNSQTLSLVGKDEIFRMKSGSFLINTGRGSCVDEKSVAAALKQGRLAGYAADVFAFEDWALANRPQRICPELLSPGLNTLFTPHLGSAVDSVRLAIEMEAAKNITDVLQGNKPRNPVNQLGADARN